MHFAILIVGDNPEEALKPFSEHLEVEYTISKQEHIAKIREEIEEYKNSEHYYKKYLQDKEAYTDEQCYEDAMGWYDPEHINEDGSTNETYNPNSKWDWYKLGGRYVGSLTLNDNHTSGKHGSKSLLDDRSTNDNKFDSATVEDIDWNHEDMNDILMYGILFNGIWTDRDSDKSYRDDNIWSDKFNSIIDEIKKDKNNTISIYDCHI